MTGIRKMAPLIGALWIAEVTGAFETAMILAALKKLIEDFGDPALVGWLITGYLIVAAAVAAVVGRLGDLYGRQRLLVIVLAIGAVGSLISAFSTNFPVLLTGRLMQGMTGAVLPLTIGIVQENMSRDRTPMVIGLLMSGASIGTAAGLVLGGMIVDHFSWHGIFFASAGLCAVSALAALAVIPRSTRFPSTQPVDWISGLAFAPGVVLVLLYFTLGKSWGWGDGRALASLGIGLLLIIWWLRQSLSSPNPLIAVRSFADRNIGIAAIVTAFVALGTLQIVVVFSLLMQAPVWTIAGLGLTATIAGLAKLPSNFGAIFAGPLGGWLAGRGGGRLAMIIGGLITAAGWAMYLVTGANSVTSVMIQLIVIAFGTTMLFSVAPTIVAQASPPERVSETTGMLGVIRGLCMGIGAQMVTTLLAVDVVRRGDEIYPSTFAYDLTIGVIVGLTLAAVAASFALPRNIRPQEQP